MITKGGRIMTIKKRFTAICAAVAIMTSLSAMSASAFTATYYGRATGGSVTNAYVSCLSNGVHPGDIITGIAWTKTSSNKNNVFNPNCAYSGYIYASASVGGVGCGSSYNNNASGIEHSFQLSGCTTTKNIDTIHIFNSSYFGHFSKSVSTTG